IDTKPLDAIVAPPAISAAPGSLPSAETPEAKSAAKKPALVSDSPEPEQGLSPESKKILKKVPSGLDKKKPGKPEKLAIDHAKDTGSELKDDVSAQPVEHEAAGIKIEIKKQQANLNYELDKAYNALIAGQTEAAIEIYKG